MRTTIRAGTHVTHAIVGLIETANETGETLEAEFNGVDLVVTPGVDPAAVEQKWHEERDRRAREYAASPQGRAAAAAIDRRATNDQQTVDTLMAQLPTLDFDSHLAVIDWMERLTDPADNSSVRYDREMVVQVFAEHGYESNVNCGEAFDADDADNVARWLIGQGLDGIRSVGAPHSVFHKFANQWRERFAT